MVRRLLRRWYVRWIALPLLVLVAAHAGWTVVLMLRFEGRLDELRALGAPVDHADLRRPIPWSDNGAPDLARAKHWYEENLRPVKPGVLADPETRKDPEDWAPTDWTNVRAWLRKGDPLVVLLERAAKRSQQSLVWKDGWADLPSLLDTTTCVHLLRRRVRFAERATTEALDELALLLTLLEKMERPFALPLLVRWSLERQVLATLAGLAGKPGFDAQEARTRLDGFFGAATNPQFVRDALWGERAIAISLSRRWIGGASPSEIVQTGEDLDFMDFVLASWLGRPLAYRDGLRALDLMDRFVRLQDLPLRGAAAAASATLEKGPTTGTLPDLVPRFFGLLPARIFIDRPRHVAAMRIARVGLALLQLRQETGEWPRSLDAVIPLVGAETVVDPYTDERLQYEPGVRLDAAVPIPEHDYEDEEDRELRRIVWRFK